MKGQPEVKLGIIPSNALLDLSVQFPVAESQVYTGFFPPKVALKPSKNHQ